MLVLKMCGYSKLLVLKLMDTQTFSSLWVLKFMGNQICTHNVLIFDSPGVPNCHVKRCICCFFIVLNPDLFVNRDDTLTSVRVIMRTEQPTNDLCHLEIEG